jgi:hypothetical protein
MDDELTAEDIAWLNEQIDADRDEMHRMEMQDAARERELELELTDEPF